MSATNDQFRPKNIADPADTAEQLSDVATLTRLNAQSRAIGDFIEAMLAHEFPNVHIAGALYAPYGHDEQERFHVALIREGADPDKVCHHVRKVLAGRAGVQVSDEDARRLAARTNAMADLSLDGPEWMDHEDGNE